MQFRNYEDTNVYARALQHMTQYLERPHPEGLSPAQIATDLLMLLRDDGITMIDPSAKEDVGENVTMAFDAFSRLIAPYGFSGDLWEEHLDDVVGVLRSYDLYPLDDEKDEFAEAGDKSDAL